jgi:hypothetical protein
VVDAVEGISVVREADKYDKVIWIVSFGLLAHDETLACLVRKILHLKEEPKTSFSVEKDLLPSTNTHALTTPRFGCKRYFDVSQPLYGRCPLRVNLS